MRLVGWKSMLFGALALLVVGVFTGCENPLDPINESEIIQGLAYFDPSPMYDRWDADPELDGIVLTLNYYNEFNGTISFRDKPHNVVVELWSQKPESETSLVMVRDELLYSKTFVYTNSDDRLYMPIETYFDYLPEPTQSDPPADPPLTKATADSSGFMRVLIYPPQEYPQREMWYIVPATFYTYEPDLADTQ